MPRTTRKYGKHKHKNNTIKYTWGIHSITRKRMKTLIKPKRRSKRSRRKRKSRRRRTKKGGRIPDPAGSSAAIPLSAVELARQRARAQVVERTEAARERAARGATRGQQAERTEPSTDDRWQCNQCVQL